MPFLYFCLFNLDLLTTFKKSAKTKNVNDDAKSNESNIYHDNNKEIAHVKVKTITILYFFCNFLHLPIKFF